MKNYEEKYKFCINNILQLKINGITKEKILNSERELGIILPISLKCYYELFGLQDKINKKSHRLLLADELYTFTEDNDEHIIFYEENQNVCCWGININSNSKDPPVYISCDEDGCVWDIENDRLSDFLISMAYLQAICEGGGMKFSGSGYINDKIKYDTLLKNIRNKWQLLHTDNQFYVFGEIGFALMIMRVKTDDLQMIYAVSNHKKQIVQADNIDGVFWDFLG